MDEQDNQTCANPSATSQRQPRTYSPGVRLEGTITLSLLRAWYPETPIGLQTLPSGWVPSLRSVCSYFKLEAHVPFFEFASMIAVKFVANSRTFLVKHSSVMSVRPPSGILHSL